MPPTVPGAPVRAMPGAPVPRVSSDVTTGEDCAAGAVADAVGTALGAGAADGAALPETGAACANVNVEDEPISMNHSQKKAATHPRPDPLTPNNQRRTGRQRHPLPLHLPPGRTTPTSVLFLVLDRRQRAKTNSTGRSALSGAHPTNAPIPNPTPQPANAQQVLPNPRFEPSGGGPP